MDLTALERFTLVRRYLHEQNEPIVCSCSLVGIRRTCFYTDALSYRATELQIIRITGSSIWITEGKVTIRGRRLIVHGSDKVVDRLVQFMQKAHTINVCIDNMQPSLAMESKQMRRIY